MSKPTTLLALLLLVVIGAFAAAPAGATSVGTILDDCSNSPTGLLQGSYSKGDLRKAIKGVRGDVAEYTGCYDAITAELRRRAPATNDGDGRSDDGGGGSGGGDAGTGGSGSGGDGFDSGSAATDGRIGGDGTTGTGATGGGATTAAPTAPTTQQPGSDEPVKLAGTAVVPGFGDTGEASSRALPTPLLVFLVLLAAGAVGVAASTIGRRVLARRRA